MSLYVKIKKKLGNFNLDVEFESNDETVALLGESGSGKSMTLKCIAGIEKPDEGLIILNGRVLFDSQKKINLPSRKRNVGILFQNYALFPNMTVEGNITVAMKGASDAEKRHKVEEMVELFCLQGLEKKHPSQLSGGQQQRVATARLLASSPDIILLDEPFSALDSHLRWKLELQLTEDLSRFNGTVILVSHNRDEAYRMSNEIIVIKNGKCTLPMDKVHLFGDPGTVDAAVVSGCRNIVSATRLDEHHVRVPQWGVDMTTESEVMNDLHSIGIRAHLIERDGDQNVLNCTVCRVIEGPFECSVILSLNSAPNSESGEEKLLYWQISITEDLPNVGDTINLYVPIDKVLLLT